MPFMMKVLIIEDEEAAAKRLAKLIKEIIPDVEILEILDSIEDAVEWFNSNPAPDIVLMDIHLADGSSFKIFEKVELKSPVIFITAYDQYAIQAFKVNSIDYLLKPIKRPELEQAINKFRDIKKYTGFAIDYQKLASTIKNEKGFQKRFVIKVGQSLKAVEASEIAYIYTDNKITFVCTFDKKRLPSDHSIDKLEEQLDPEQFFRINRQYLVNIKAINEMVQYSKGRVKLKLQPKAPEDPVVSVIRSPHFKQWLEGK